MKVEIDIAPFTVPPRLCEALQPAEARRFFEFSEISPDDLGELCDDFKRAVFEKAGYPEIAIIIIPKDGGESGVSGAREVPADVTILYSFRAAKDVGLLATYNAIKSRDDLTGKLLALQESGEFMDWNIRFAEVVEILHPSGAKYWIYL